MDIHALIQEFLQQQTVVVPPPTGGRLGGGHDSPRILSPHPNPPPAGEGITKAGVVPFLRDPYRYYLMKPVAKNPAPAAPKFQLCKGTRMMKVDGKWQDIREGEEAGEKETLAATALREGIEELGLRLQNIKQLIRCRAL